MSEKDLSPGFRFVYSNTRIALVLLLIVTLIFSQGCNGDGIRWESGGTAISHGKGVAMVAGRHAAAVVYYAEDGLHFKPAGPFPKSIAIEELKE